MIGRPFRRPEGRNHFSLCMMGLWLMLGWGVSPRSPAAEGATTTHVFTLAVAPFEGERPLTGAIQALIAQDLEGSGRFHLIPELQQPERLAAGQPPDFARWGGLGEAYLLTGAIQTAPRTQDLHLHLALYALSKSQALLDTVLPLGEGDARHAAHAAADHIYRTLTGSQGGFNSRLAWVLKEQAAGQNRYRLIVADRDGEDARVIVSSKEPLLSPAWSPDGHRMAYVSFEEGNSAIFIQDLVTGARRRLAAFAGINSAPAWSPDGTEIAMSLSKEGTPDLYLMDVGSGTLHRVTRDEAVETEPSWSPDGKRLLFTSDRGGTPQIYEISAQGGDAERLTFEGAYNTSAVFAPDGVHIVMVHRGNCGDCIALLYAPSRKIKLISKGPQDSSPSFSPNGREVLMVEQTERGAGLVRLSIDGQPPVNIPSPGGDVRAAAWSP